MLDDERDKALQAIRAGFLAAFQRVREWEPAPLEPEPTERLRPLTKQQQAWFDAYGSPERITNRDWLYGDDPLLTSNRSWWR